MARILARLAEKAPRSIFPRNFSPNYFTRARKRSRADRIEREVKFRRRKKVLKFLFFFQLTARLVTFLRKGNRVAREFVPVCSALGFSSPLLRELPSLPASLFFRRLTRINTRRGTKRFLCSGFVAGLLSADAESNYFSSARRGSSLGPRGNATASLSCFGERDTRRAPPLITCRK